MKALAFHNTQFDVIDRNGQPWLGVTRLGWPLNTQIRKAMITKLYNRNANEFTDKMTALVDMPTKGGIQQVRIFSLRGAHMLAMFARTKVAKEFRHWALDVLEGEAEAPTKAKRKPKLLPNGLTGDQQDAIKALVKAAWKSCPRTSAPRLLSPAGHR